MAPAKKGTKDLELLKRELELDEHRISLEDLYRRMKCDPVKVSFDVTSFLFFIET
jgi:sodium/potassium-transporting ATPase subunit alpha